MPGIKDDREDSEGEEMDHESDQSDKSTSSCDSSDASDSDDSSEMDEEECERRRVDCIDSLADMEKQFNVLREQLYQERITQVDAKLGEVKLGRAHEYLQPLEQLQENLRIRNEVAGILRNYRMTNVRNKFQAEETAALQNYQSEKILLWDSIKDDLEDKIRRLEEDRNNIDFSAEMWVNEQKRSGWRNGYKPGRGSNNNSRNSLDLPGRRKPLTVSGPYVVYMLSEEDIMEDWTAIKKALSVCKRKSEHLPSSSHSTGGWMESYDSHQFPKPSNSFDGRNEASQQYSKNYLSVAPQAVGHSKPNPLQSGNEILSSSETSRSFSSSPKLLEAYKSASPAVGNLRNAINVKDVGIQRLSSLHLPIAISNLAKPSVSSSQDLPQPSTSYHRTSESHQTVFKRPNSSPRSGSRLMAQRKRAVPVAQNQRGQILRRSGEPPVFPLRPGQL